MSTQLTNPVLPLMDKAAKGPRTQTYFIYSRSLDAIKIGKTSRSLSERYDILEALEVIFVLDGDYESALHAKFAKYRVIKREWFKAAPVLRFLKSLTFPRRRIRGISGPMPYYPAHMEPYLARQMYLEVMDSVLQ